MALARSVFLNYPQPKVSNLQVRNHSWCRPEAGSTSCTWGTVQQLDLGGKGYSEPYRTGGSDCGTLIVNRPYGPSTRDFGAGCPPSNRYYPFCDAVTYGIFVNKGALPHQTEDEFSSLSQQGGYDFVADVLCKVNLAGQFAYYLYKDKTLTNVCNPGGHFTILTKSEEVSSTVIYKPQDSYAIAGAKIGATTLSGATQLKLEPYWEVTATGVGFYKDTSYMKTGGFLQLGPNIDGDISICKITSIISPTEVGVTEIIYDFQINDSLYYWYSSTSPTHYLPAAVGINPDPLARFGDIVTTEQKIEVKGGLNTFTTVETFIPIPWAIPAPYSIRNVPHTNIWLRLDDPSIPFNMNTLEFKVNGVNVTDDVEITYVSGGIELLYNPPVNFDLASRVYIDIHVSCSPSVYRTFSEASPAASKYIWVGGGDLSIFQSGGVFRLGPNPAGDWEMATMLRFVGEGEIELETATENEYTQGDLIAYTNDNYSVDLNYYFDIVDDFRPPTFENIYPFDGMEDVNRQQWIMFDIKDEGLGVDISTLSLTIDNMIVIPQVYKYSDSWYRVIYSPTAQYYYNATVNCFATVMDLSSRKNRAFAVWSFHTESGELPILINPVPYFCAYPVHHKSHLGVDLYARGGGANLHSMIFTWDQKEYKVITYPKIYRQS